MNIGELFKTKRWKTFMGYVYGWGAAIVMIGALFKLEHLPYSGVLLAVGLCTEAFIFFLSAFEPPLEMPEWSRVYPELREDYELEGFEELDKRGKKGFNELFSSSELTPELLDKVGKGLNDLSNTAKGISDISSATLATDMYVKNLGSASESMGVMAEINNKANESINKSVGSLVESYTSAAQKISESGVSTIDRINKSGEEFSVKLANATKILAETYQNAGTSVTTDIETIKDSSKQYAVNLQKLNSSLQALSSNFETQLKATEDQFKASQSFNRDLNEMSSLLVASVDELKKYKENAEQLNKNLESLNMIYGNMLGAMNYKK
ncbi:MAG: gliding motility protein GldL [Prolixibacteraceae bacterium]|nr:gliding motility protein GldL [Prolixibacteraceae bacterium]